MEHGHTIDEIRGRFAQSPKRNYIGDFIYGGIDGAVTTFAIVAGVEGAGLSPIVIITLGIANVLADGFSMAASNYSGTKADLDNTARLRAVERHHIKDVPEGEREEVREILRQKGLSGQSLEGAVKAITSDEETWISLMISEEYGISTLDPHPLNAALVTFGAFLACGIIPLIPFFTNVEHPFIISIVATGITFFIIGAMKSSWSLVSWWRSGFETFLIGSAAALIAYGAGYLVSGFVPG